jgi:hypothetical protein
MNEQQTSQPTSPSTDQIPSVVSVSSVPSTPPTFDDELNLLRTENSELKHQLRLRIARDELTRTLASENARSPELLFEAASARLVFDEAGNLTNLSDIITDIKSRFPEQFVIEQSEPQQPAPLLTKEGWRRLPPTGWFSPTGQNTEPSSPPAINAGAGRIGARPPLTKETLAAMKPRDIANLNWNDVKQIMES